MKRALVLLLAVGAVAVVVAGCGGGGGNGGGKVDKASYEKAMQTLQKELSAAASSLGDIKPTDLGSLSDVFGKAADLMQKAADSLAKIDAPAEIADLQKKFVDAARQAADKLKELADKAKGKSVQELAPLLAELGNLDAFKKLGEIVNEIQAKGFDIGGS